MKTRVTIGLLIAAVYALTLVGAIYLHAIVFDIFILAVMGIAAWEMCNCIEKGMSKPLFPFVLIDIVVCYAVFKISILLNMSIGYAVLTFSLATFIMAIITFFFCHFNKNYLISNALSTIFVMFYPVLVMMYFLALNYISPNVRVGGLIIVFLGASFADMGAYFVGSLIKGPKLCPKISPKKTISGAIGGLFGGILAGVILFFAGKFNIVKVTSITSNEVYDLINWIFIGLGAALFCEIGDLIASAIKRKCGIKDYSNILGSHGGVMDRVDGMIISAVFVYIYLTVLLLFV